MPGIAERPSSFERWLNEESSWDQRHDDREYLPAFSAHRSEEEGWRLPRLTRTYATACSLFLLVEQRPLPSTIIVSLHDHRGQLTVTTSSEEWWQFVEPLFQLAWRSENERATHVDHKVVGRY